MSEGDNRNRQEGRGLCRGKTTEQLSLDERAAADAIAALGGAVDRRASCDSGSNSGSGGEGGERSLGKKKKNVTMKRSRSSFDSGGGVVKGSGFSVVNSSSGRERTDIDKASKNVNALMEAASVMAASAKDERATQENDNHDNNQELVLDHPRREHLLNDHEGDSEVDQQEVEAKRARLNFNQDDHDANSKAGALNTTTFKENESETVHANSYNDKNLDISLLPPTKKKSRFSGLDSDSNMGPSLNMNLNSNLNSRSNLNDPQLTNVSNLLTSNRVSNPQGSRSKDH
ncbi:hypothetical protein ACHAXS_006530 [Conticribra weissflogii]